MKKLLIPFLSFFIFAQVVYAQTLTQTVKGQVLDADSRQPLAGAKVMIKQNNTVSGGLSDEEGYFRLESVPVGRNTLVITYLGFETYTLQDAMVTSGKELVLNIQLTEALEPEATKETALKTVTITDAKSPQEANNEMATLSARSFSVEETKRYAAAISDPARMAQNFAGVTSSGFDMDNEIVIRGNSPRYMLWRLEGVEIPNPNHFGSMGGSGGPISMLSSSTLANSDFYTGAFPAEFGNALSGVFDLRFRRGNSEKREYSLMLGVLGLEASTEGYFSKKSRASYLFNYRYSTLALMQNFLPSLEGVLPKYQDASFNIFLPSKKLGNFSFFGLGGANTATETAVADSSQWLSEGDATTFSSNQKVAVVGVKHNLLLGERTFIRTTVAASLDNYTDISHKLLPEQNYFADPYDTTDFQNYSLRLHTMVSHKLSTRQVLRYGLIVNHMSFDYRYDQKDWWDQNVWTTYLKNDGATQLFQSYAQYKYRLNQRWTANVGLHGSLLALNGKGAIDPRAAISWQANKRQRVSLALGLHSKPEHISTLFVEHTNPNGGRTQPNKDLAFAKAAHVVAGYDFRLGPNTNLKTEVYFQHLYDLPLAKDSGSIESIVNASGIWDVLDVEQFSSEGVGQNIGIDLTLEKSFSRDYYFLLSASLFDSKYRDQYGDWHSTRFNSNYAAKLLGGKEFKLGKDKKNRLAFNGKFIISGGNRFTPIDFAASQVAGEEVLLNDRPYEDRVPAYWRFDLGVSYAINTKRATHTILLDLQNVSNRQNIYTQYYDSEVNSLRYYYQNGIFPILNYRVEF